MGHATEVEGGPDESPARRILAAKYQGWTDGQALIDWARDALSVAIDLAAAMDLWRARDSTVWPESGHAVTIEGDG